MASIYDLGEHFDGFVKDMIASGRYASVSEVMRDGLRLMQERERQREAKLGALRASIQEGFDSGPSAPLDMEDVRRKAHRRWVDKNASGV